MPFMKVEDEVLAFALIKLIIEKQENYFMKNI